jgi:hypothetical protein
MAKAKKKENPHVQIREFRKAARELGADQSDERFKDALRKIAKHKPSGRSERKPTNKSSTR